MSNVSFQSTVDRAMVHRAAVAEVFVTDVQRLREQSFLAAAQLPAAHSYYSDHLGEPQRFDLLLIAEAGRQAAMYAAHEYLGVPLGSAFAVHSQSVDCTDDGPLCPGGAPGELHIAMTCEQIRRRGTRVRQFEMHQRFELAGRPAGTATMVVSPMTGEEYRALRFLRRRSDPPTTAELRGRPHQPSLPAALVGRRNTANVVVTDLVPGDPGPTVTLAPAFAHRGMFDHDYDHHPGMILLEAARQFALLVAGTGGHAGPDATLVATGIQAEFRRFAELDDPVLLSMPGPAVRVEPGALAVPVRIRQGTDLVAEATCRLRIGVAG